MQDVDKNHQLLRARNFAKHSLAGTPVQHSARWRGDCYGGQTLNLGFTDDNKTTVAATRGRFQQHPPSDDDFEGTPWPLFKSNRFTPPSCCAPRASPRETLIR